MEYKKQASSGITPRIIIHGGAGNILPSNLPPKKYKQYHDSLLKILASTHYFMTSPSSFPLATASSTSALDTRGVGLMGLQHVKNPIKLAREMLLHGEKDLEGGNGEHRGPMAEDLSRSSGAQGHCQLYKHSAENLAKQWGMEMVDPSYYFVQARWDEHIKGIEKDREGGVATWDAEDFFPQGTCGAVALDSEGSTTAVVLSEALKGLMADCLPNPMAYSPLPKADIDPAFLAKGDKVFRAAAMSGTGNGDSFLRINAVRTASAIARYRGSKSNEKTSLQDAVTEVTGPGGELVKSAGDRWGKSGEGEGGIIGVELTVHVDAHANKKSVISHIVDDFNCGGMFRAAVDKNGKAVMRVWKPKQHEGLEAYEGEGREYDLRDWLEEKM
ncbi:putative isoaspartyl peptidase/L-asparaginase [Lachnellula willkommii]|uniref:Putative isoaspartyl peptidase/L-asparaginase n=1 Tax=Lachnellula willkommii TaxID=215461 RepID=A0A559MJP7_9HELO|nr:putative isoaspartyl peptidase/L-asparaginase [Lachnellula willkommii]